MLHNNIKMSFNCNTCSKKFDRKDYKNCDKLETLDTNRNKGALGDHHIDGTNFSKTKYFQHLTIPITKSVRKTTTCGHNYLEPRIKPWLYICPKSRCIICLVKTGNSDTFTTRDQFNYHRKANCPYDQIKYADYIRRKLYDSDNTLSTALECISSDEEEVEEKPREDPSESESSEEEEILDETQTLGYRDTLEFKNKVKKGYNNRSLNYKDTPISTLELEKVIHNVY